VLHNGSGFLHEQPSLVVVSSLRNLPQCLLASVECSSGTTANQATKSRPLRNAAPLPIRCQQDERSGRVLLVLAHREIGHTPSPAFCYPAYNAMHGRHSRE
jgi:hypothetical protein